MANGLNDCIGALAPPEVGMLHVWPDGIKINGAHAGAFRVEASSWQADAVPEWLVIGMALALSSDHANPGERPDATALAEEGCGHITRVRLLESWSRHTLVWINRWSDDGFRPIFEAWLARADGRGSEITLETSTGTFLGLDEQGGLLLKTDDGPLTIPLIEVLRHGHGWPLEADR